MHLLLTPNPEFPVPKGISLRILGTEDIPLLVGHLTGLDDAGRHDRFNGTVDMDGIADYARRCIQPGVMVLAAEQNGHVIGVAELHPATLNIAEAAFSVDAPWRGKGIGGALFSLILEAAWSRGLSELEISTHSDNDAMKKLARRFGAEMSFDRGDSVGRINLQDVRMLEG
jgi:GNAT superfamily N-acetyltransferase